MFTIKRGSEFLKGISTHVFNGELIRTVAWVSDPSKAKKFDSFNVAEIIDSALGYSDTYISKVNF